MRLSINGRFGLTGATVMGWIALAADSGEQELSFVATGGRLLERGTWEPGAGGALWVQAPIQAPETTRVYRPPRKRGWGVLANRRKGMEGALSGSKNVPKFAALHH